MVEIEQLPEPSVAASSVSENQPKKRTTPTMRRPVTANDMAAMQAKMKQLMSEAIEAASKQEPGTWLNSATGRTEPRKTTIPQGWNDWLVENLKAKCLQTTLIDVMFKEHGFAHSAIMQAIQQANSKINNGADAGGSVPATAAAATAAAATATATAASPPTAHINESFTQRKSKWTLELMNFMDEMDQRPRKITMLSDFPTLTDFRQDYAAQNKPLLVRTSGGGGPVGWPVNKWTFDYFLKLHVNEDINVQSGRATDVKYEEQSVQHRTQMPMSEFINRLRNGPANDVYMTANNAAQNREFMNKMLGTLPNLGPDTDPYLDVRQLTTRAFLWIGTKGTYTPLHHDNTNNGFVQISGHKRVHLAPPWASTNLYNHAHVFAYVDPRNIDTTKYPKAAKVRWMTFDLGPGDFLFIPQGWWHTVEGLDENVSVSFTCWKPCISHFSGSM